MTEALSKSSLGIAVDINSVCEQCSEMTQSQGHVRGSPKALVPEQRGLFLTRPWWSDRQMRHCVLVWGPHSGSSPDQSPRQHPHSDS